MASKREREQREKRKRKSAGEWANEQDRTFEPTSVRLPEGKKFLTLRPGIIRIDIIPYVAGAGNPAADKGHEHFERVYFRYALPMPTGKTRYFVASGETFGHKDFVAEWAAAHRGTADPKLLEKLRPQRRHLWNVIDVTDESERKKGIQVFDSKYGTIKYPEFGKMLKDKIQMSKRYANFDDPEKGFTIVIKVEEDSFSGTKFNRVTAVDLEEREKQYEDSIIDEAICLDDCLVETPYEEMKKIFLTGHGERVEEKETPAPSKNGHAKAKEEDEDEDLEEEDEDEGDDDPTAEDLGIVKGSKVTYRKQEWKVVKVSGDGTSLALEDDDGEQERGVAPSAVKLLKEEEDDDELDEEDEDEEDPTPARGAGKTSKPATARKPSTSDDDDDEDELDEEDELEEDEDEEEEPAPKKRRVG